MSSELTILNSMADNDFEMCLAIHKQWSLHWLDLRDNVFGKAVAELDVPTARKAKAAIDKAGGFQVCCLSSSLLFDDVAKGERHFREKHLARVGGVVAAANILKPKFVRLIGATYLERVAGQNSIEAVEAKYPWLIKVYQEAIDQIAAAGHVATIENESPSCILVSPDEVLAFFDALNRKGAVGYTWDIQNQWGCGLFPTVAQYDALKPLIHVKGGRYDDERGKKLDWNVALEDANWPIREIIGRVAADGVSPVICINMPFHGATKPGYDYSNVTRRDVDFMRTIAGVK